MGSGLSLKENLLWKLITAYKKQGYIFIRKERIDMVSFIKNILFKIRRLKYEIRNIKTRNAWRNL